MTLQTVSRKCQCPCGCDKEAEDMEDLCYFCLEYHEELRREFVIVEPGKSWSFDKLPGSLTVEGKQVLKLEFDSIEDIRKNYFPDRNLSDDDIVAALNYLGHLQQAELVDLLGIFFMGMDYARECSKEGC